MTAKFALQLKSTEGVWYEVMSSKSRPDVERFARAYREAKGICLPSRIVHNQTEDLSILLSERHSDGRPVHLYGFLQAWRYYESEVRANLERMAQEADIAAEYHDDPDAMAGSLRARAALKILEGK